VSGMLDAIVIEPVLGFTILVQASDDMQVSAFLGIEEWGMRVIYYEGMVGDTG